MTIKIDFKRSLDFILSLVNYEIKPPKTSFDFSGFMDFLQAIGSPHKDLTAPILVVGTKGKGSTSHFLTQGLLSLNKKVGLFTSPHLVDIRERIRIGFEKVSIRDFNLYTSKIQNYASLYPGLTFFEALTTMALLYFKDKNLDYEIFEVGLGGRLDATNAVNQRIALITKIGYDHEKILGSSIEEIAREKGMVMKKGSKAISVPQRKKVKEILKKVAKENFTEILFLGEDIPFYFHFKNSNTYVNLDFKGSRDTWRVPKPGNFQVKNLALAASCLIELGYKDFSFEGVHLSGRFDIIQKNPPVILDGAHNPFSIYTFLSEIKREFQGKPFYIIFGINRDKNLKRVFQVLSKFREFTYVFTRSLNPRAVSPDVLKDIGNERRLDIYGVFDEPRGAFTHLLKKKDRGIAITGSFYLLEEIYRQLKTLPE